MQEMRSRWTSGANLGLSALAALLMACGGAPVRAVSKVQSKLPLTVHRHVLANGLEVLLQEDHHTPFVAIDIGYRVGSRDDPPGRSGLAHLFEHLMFEGSMHVKFAQGDDLLNNAGAYRVNGNTNHDQTTYYETVPAKYLELGLWLESDRMGFLVEGLDDHKLEKQRAIVKHELRQHYENVAYGLVHTIIGAELFPKDHPYHRDTIGTSEDLDAVTLEEARAFFNRYYVPDNATLVMVGDFDEKAALALVSKYFDAIPRGVAPLARWPRMEVALEKDKTITIEADVEAPRVVFAWPMAHKYSPSYWDVTIAAQFIAGRIESELTTADADNMTDPTKIAHTVSYSWRAEELAGALYIDVTLHPGKDPIQARAAIEDVLIHTGRYRTYERNSVYRAGTNNATALVFDLEEIGTRADVFIRDNQLAGDALFIKSNLQNFDALDPTEVKDAFKDEILRKSGVVAIVIPKSGAPKGGRVVSVQ